MISFAPVKKNKKFPQNPLLDNVNQVRKILYRFKAQGTFFFKSLKKGVPLSNLLIVRLPFAFSDAKLPPSMNIELTDACNLKCVYCNNPSFAHPRKIMNDETFNNLLLNLKGKQIHRVCLGGGEPTMHPKFVDYLQRIRIETRILTIVSNAQWTNDSIPEMLVKNNVDLIEISVDAGGKEMYEKSRVGASYDLLKENLLILKAFKKQHKSTSQINIRLMVRPSNLKNENQEKKYWKKYCDTIMPQYLMRLEDTLYEDDVFVSKYKSKKDYPKCTYPFKNMQVRATGDVYLCPVSGSALKADKKLLIGNINNSNFYSLWNSPILKQYRNAHRERKTELMTICKGCRGC